MVVTEDWSSTKDGDGVVEVGGVGVGRRGYVGGNRAWKSREHSASILNNSVLSLIRKQAKMPDVF